MLTETTTTTLHSGRRVTKTYIAFSELFDTLRYPAGESHLALTANTSHCSYSRGDQVTIEMAVHNFDDLGQLITADRLLRRTGVTAQWFVPYFPFARHDRRNHAADGFELGVALDMVRDLDIVIADPHSDVAGQLTHIPQIASVDCFRDAGLFAHDPIIVIPDAGATKKASDWANGRTVQALKHRDPATGRLSGFEVLADDLNGAPCVIVDDICDGGGTFLGIATALAAKNAGPLSLAITHGLFTKGTTSLAQAFAHIITFEFAARANHTHRAEGVDYLPFEDLYTKGARR